MKIHWKILKWAIIIELALLIAFNAMFVMHFARVGVLLSGDNENARTKIESHLTNAQSYMLSETLKYNLNPFEMYAIIKCESEWNVDAFHVNTNGSVDFGVAQINSIHKDISTGDKLDYRKAIDWMIQKRLRDGNFNAWTCFNKVNK